MQRSNGYTLIELMVAVAVMAVIAAVAIPAYRGYIDTGQRQALTARVDTFRMFQDSWKVDNGSFLPGNYASGGVNDFAVAGYIVRGDDDGLVLSVGACDTGTLDTCFKVTAKDNLGHKLVWQSGTYTWQ